MSLSKLKQLNLLVLLFCFIHRADGQVTFHYNEGPQKIDLRCDVGSLSLTNLSHLDCLVISKLVSDQWQALASLSPHCAQNGPVSHVPDAEVNGQISSAGLSSSFLQIYWGNAQPKLDGNYKCEAQGVDSNFMPASTKQELEIPVQNAPLLFFTTPEIISIGLSPTLDINCSVSHSIALNMSTLVSLSILRVHEGVEQILAYIKSGHDVSTKPGADGVFVEGSVDPHEGFISMGWISPGVDEVGVYFCEAIGINAKGDPVFLSARKNVTWEKPSRRELAYRLSEMYRTKAALENRLARMNQSKVDLETRLVEMNKTKSDLENRLLEMNQTKVDLENRFDKTEKLARDATEEIARLNKSICATSCSDVTLPVGQHEVTLVPDNLGPLKVLCDVRNRDEIWTIFQKRFDGSVDFYRNFSEYENGFGSINGEHWLGLKHIKRLLDASGNNHELHVDMVKTSAGTRYTRIYPTFSIGSGDNYTLTVAGYDDGGKGMSLNNGGAFCTYDHGPYQDYARKNSAGWWYAGGTNVNLNGLWGGSGTLSSIWWWEIGKSLSATFSATEMKFRSTN